MIEYSSNMKEIIDQKLAQLQMLKDNADPVIRTVALTVASEMVHRVHVDGKDSSGNQIGTYSPEYMRVRTGSYKNAEKFSKGKKKGELKNAGKYTKGLDIKISGTIVLDSEKKGILRPQYHRSADTKVILSLTRQMESDLTVCATNPIKTDNGYGIGYLNHFNYQKALWCEETYKKPILTELTVEEKALADSTAQNFTTEYLKAS
ncbi:MAG: hypothetical protein ABI237_05950 [Ginsengibacter sp.]